MKFTGILFSFFVLALIACNIARSNAGGSTEKLLPGKLINLTGLDGCGWIIELQEQTKEGVLKLEPVNLRDFQIEPKEGLKVLVSWEKYPGASTCMAGQLATIKSIRLPG